MTNIRNALLGLLLLACLVSPSFAYYHPEEGRFINRDPIGERGGLNLYVLTGNHPVNAIDSLGMAGFSELCSCARHCSLAACIKANKLKDDTLDEARQRTNDDDYGDECHNNSCDAVRHCMWSCELAKSVGGADAECVTTNHENENKEAGQSSDEENMDLGNNAIGNHLGIGAGGQDCGDLCEQALDDGLLREEP